VQEAGEAIADEIEHALGLTFDMLADTGRPNAMAWDVVLSAIIIGLWTALAEADPRTMFRCTLLPWLKDDDEVAVER
jgi:hypothetical protein